MPSSHKKPGPFSRDQSLTAIDHRTRAGRVLKGVHAELVAHIGDPTPGQRLLIQAAALKATRLALLSERLLRDETLSEGSDNHALAWLNSMRLDLQALGLERKAVRTITLADYVAKAADTEAAP